MKKKLQILMGILVMIAVMVMTLTFDVNSDNKNDIKLNNVEALACFDLEENGEYLGQCCAPWFNVCYMYSTTVYIDGERS